MGDIPALRAMLGCGSHSADRPCAFCTLRVSKASADADSDADVEQPEDEVPACKHSKPSADAADNAVEGDDVDGDDGQRAEDVEGTQEQVGEEDDDDDDDEVLPEESDHDSEDEQEGPATDDEEVIEQQARGMGERKKGKKGKKGKQGKKKRKKSFVPSVDCPPELRVNSIVRLWMEEYERADEKEKKKLKKERGVTTSAFRRLPYFDFIRMVSCNFILAALDHLLNTLCV